MSLLGARHSVALMGCVIHEEAPRSGALPAMSKTMTPSPSYDEGTSPCRTPARGRKLERELRKLPLSADAASVPSREALADVLWFFELVDGVFSLGNRSRSAALARAHEALHVRGGRLRERVEVVTAFEDGDQPALGMTVRDRQQLLGQPDEIVGLDLELRQRVGAMGVEARRHDDELGRKTVEHRQGALAPGGAELGAARAAAPRPA